MLVKDGADVTASREGGQTPLMYAAHRGLPAILAFLIENGAQFSVNKADATGKVTKCNKIPNIAIHTRACSRLDLVL